MNVCLNVEKSLFRFCFIFRVYRFAFIEVFLFCFVCVCGECLLKFNYCVFVFFCVVFVFDELIYVFVVY